MAAAAFLASLVFAQGAANSPVRKQYNCTVSDVTAAFYLFPDGNSFVNLPAGGPWYLVDVMLSAAGTDTRTATIFANGLATGISVLNAANLGTNYSRQFMSAPMKFAGGANVRFTQLT